MYVKMKTVLMSTTNPNMKKFVGTQGILTCNENEPATFDMWVRGVIKTSKCQKMSFDFETIQIVTNNGSVYLFGHM